MEINDILLEWSYRLKKGYPTMKDGKFTEPSELEVLHEILKENGIDEMPSFVKSKTPVSDVIGEAEEEETATLTIQDLISILSNPETKLSSKTIQKVSRLISRNADFEEAIELKVKEFLAEDQKKGLESVMEILYGPSTDQAKLSAYLNNRTVGLDQFMGKEVKIKDAFNDTGLSAQTLAELSTYRWSDTPQLGTCEVLLAILMDGGRRPSGAGDLQVGDQIVELGGFNKRLRSQKGLGSSMEVQKGIQRAYRDFAESLGIGDRFTPITENARYGNSLKSGWLPTMEEMNAQIIELTKGDVTNALISADLPRAIGEGLSKGLTNTSDSDWNWIGKSLNDDGTFNRKPFIVDYACFYLDYYMRQGEEASMFLVTNSTPSSTPPVPATDFSLLGFPASGDGLRPHLYTDIGLTLPSYTEAAGIQGVAFALKLGKVASAFAEGLEEEELKLWEQD